MTTSISEEDSGLGTGSPTYTMGPKVDGIRYGTEFIEDYPTDELLAAYAEHLGPCWICGRDDMTDESDCDREFLVGIWTRDRRLQAGRPQMNASFDRIARGTVCHQCCDASDAKMAATKDRARIDKVKARIRHLGILPKEFYGCCFSESRSRYMEPREELWEEALAWTPKSDALWIYGDKGTGKTFMARCILNAQLDKGVSVGELDAVEFNRMAIRKFYDWHDKLDAYAKVRVLLIEDIDKAEWSPHGLSELFGIMDKRYSNQRRTLITTNQTIEYCIGVWRNAVPNNKSLPGAIQDRLKPIKRIAMEGKTLRQGGKNETQGS